MNDFAVAPDGHIVYTANHSENWDLFICDADGANSRQLTFDHRFHQFPTVCDDNRTVVYSTTTANGDRLWKLDLQTGVSSALTTGPTETFPDCQGTGNWLFYFGQGPDGGNHIFKLPLSGGPPVQLSDRIAGSPPFPSMDGRHVAFASAVKEGTVAVLVVSADTGAVEAQANILPTFDQTSHSAAWLPDNRSMALADLRTGIPNLWTVPLIGNAPEKQMTHFTSGIIWAFHFSRDGKSVVMARGSHPSDVVVFNTPK